MEANFEAIFDKLGWKWRKTGKGYLVSCPFAATYHRSGQDRNPSFAIWPQIGYGKCYSCGRGERLSTLLGLPEETGTLASDLISLSNSLMDCRRDEEPQTLDPTILECFGPIPDLGRAYLEHRGFNLSCIEAFQLKFDSSRDAIVFPVFGKHGLVGCVGRTIRDKTYHNYFNFPTGKTLGGFQLFQPTRRKLALVEGFTDLLNVYQWAWELNFDVCCTFTANLSREQAVLVADTGKRVHCWYDQDQAGKKGFETVQRYLEDSDYGLTRAVWSDEKLDVGAMNRDTFFSIFSRYK